MSPISQQKLARANLPADITVRETTDIAGLTVDNSLCFAPELLIALYGQIAREAGIDFASYREKTLQRRIASRFCRLGLQSLEEYIDYVEANPKEIARLVSHILIKVSSFYRNEAVFRRLGESILPELMEQSAREGRPLRVWSLGCGNGEEPYSILILMNELSAKGHGASEKSPFRAIIYGSDADPQAIVAAENAAYSESAFTELPSVLRDRYFSIFPKSRDRVPPVSTPLYQLSTRSQCALTDCALPDIEVRFLVQNALEAAEGPEGGLFDLVLCRNMLIYLQPDARLKVFDLIARSLRAGGYLVLGEAETVPTTCCSKFSVVSKADKIYTTAVCG